MQCASSMARQATRPASISTTRPLLKRSGATYSSLRRPSRASRKTWRWTSAASALVMAPAGMPRAVSAPTWSCISAISGETTTVRPSNKSAGSW
jgi:hypothetical protein